MFRLRRDKTRQDKAMAACSGRQAADGSRTAHNYWMEPRLAFRVEAKARRGGVSGWRRRVESSSSGGRREKGVGADCAVHWRSSGLGSRGGKRQAIRKRKHKRQRLAAGKLAVKQGGSWGECLGRRGRLSPTVPEMMCKAGLALCVHLIRTNFRGTGAWLGGESCGGRGPLSL